MMVRLLASLGWLLGGLLVADGLYQRLWGVHWQLFGSPALWATWAMSLGLSPLDTGWLALMLGSAILAAAFGIYAGRRWAYWTAVAACGLGLGYVSFLGTPLTSLCLILLALAPVRRYTQA